MIGAGEVIGQRAILGIRRHRAKRAFALARLDRLGRRRRCVDALGVDEPAVTAYAAPHSTIAPAAIAIVRWIRIRLRADRVWSR
jgi:hypothetical protein